MGAVVLDRKVVAVGGHDGTERQKTVEIYDPAINQWDFLPDMHSKRSDFAVVTYQGKLIVIGGFTGEVKLKDCFVNLQFSWCVK